LADVDGRLIIGSGGLKDSIDQLGYALAEHRVHVVPEAECLQNSIGARLLPVGEMFLKGAEAAIEIVEFDKEDSIFRVLFVVFGKVADQLETHGGFSGPFGAENHCGRGLFRVANDFAPGGVKSSGNAEFPENGVCLGVLVRKRVASQLMVCEEFLFSHDPNSIVNHRRKTRS